jgi:hypothetical protein
MFSGLALCALVVGCATTQQVKVSAASAQRACAFLGASVCAKLTTQDAPGRFSGAALTGGSESVANLRYVNPNARWTEYRKVVIAPVTFWAGDTASVSPADQHALSEYASQVLQQQLATKFEVVQRPGPGVMTVQAAIVDAQAATPILRTISMAIPQARALATLKYVATGTYAFVGGATAEVKVIDSVSHEVLAAAVDRRVGGGSLATAAQWKLGDAENAMTAWAQQLTTRLSTWTSGGAPS